MSNCANNNLFGSFKEVGIQNNLKDAIEDAGVKVPSGTCLWEYPDLIRKNLVAKTISGINLLGKDIIDIEQESDGTNIEYRISTKYNTYGVERPNYAPDSEIWNNKLNMEELINELFNSILPAVRGVHFADITTVDKYGNDTKEWNNTLFNQTGNKSGLKENTRYLRLYLTSQAEPLYIYIEDSINDLNKVYNIEDSDTITFETFNVDNNYLTLTAHIDCITNEQIDALK